MNKWNSVKFWIAFTCYLVIVPVLYVAVVVWAGFEAVVNSAVLEGGVAIRETRRFWELKP